ncbi:uncharacterized protein RSE6_10189 [Rhynchosporium secalis]|uniref:Uncharacterized protein n=1 Tax=Rhynchosporium secalis TaxID=38038 RepID=A0A1E1MJS8_RHYSE|nr:uncharacterized protein RSE6_10189 [Rhynchosporium secalis]
MASPNSPKEQAYIDTNAAYARIVLQGTGQDSETTINLLLQELKSAYATINSRQTDVTTLIAQIKAATDRATTAERAAEDNAVLAVQNTGKASVETARLRAEVESLNALTGNVRDWNPDCTGCLNRISDADLKELVDFANDVTGAAPSLLANIRKLIDQQGTAWKGSKSGSGRACEIDIDEYIRLFDRTIRNSRVLQNRVTGLETQIRSGASGSVYRGEDPLLVDEEVERLGDLLDEANAEIAGHRITVQENEKLRTALDTAKIDNEQLNGKVNSALRETSYYRKQLKEGVVNSSLIPGSGHSLSDLEKARLTNDLEAAKVQSKQLKAEVATAESKTSDLQNEIFDRENASSVSGSFDPEIARLKAQLETLEDREATLNNEYSAALDKVDELEVRANDLETKRLEENLAECREGVHRLGEDQITENQVELEELRHTVEALRQQVKELTQERNQAGDQRDQVVQENADQAANADAEQQRLQALLDDCNKGRDQAEKKADAAKAKASPSGDLTKLRKEIRELKKERDDLQAQLEIAEQSPSEAAITNKDLQNQIKELNKELIKAKRDLKKSAKKFDKAEIEVDRLQGVLEDSDAEVVRIRGERTAAREERDTLRVRVETAEETLRKSVQTSQTTLSDTVRALRTKLQDAKRDASAAEVVQTNILALNRELTIERDSARAQQGGLAATIEPIEGHPENGGGGGQDDNDDGGENDDLRAQIRNLQTNLASHQLQREATNTENTKLSIDIKDLEALLETIKARLSECLKGHPDYDDEELIKALEESDRARERRENDRQNRNDASQSLRQELNDAQVEVRRLTDEIEKLKASYAGEQEDEIAELKTNLEALNARIASADSGSSLSADERAAHLLQVEPLQRRIRELEQQVEELNQQVENLRKENAKLAIDLNQVKADLLDKMLDAVGHLRKAEIDEDAVDRAEPAKDDDVLDDDEIDNNAVDHADSEPEEPSEEGDSSVEIITNRTPSPPPTPKTRKGRKPGKKTAAKAAEPKKTRGPAKGKKAAKAVEDEPVVAKRQTRSSAAKRKEAPEKTVAKGAQPKDKKRKIFE